MRFHLIDRVDSYEPARSVRARKLTSYSEDYWEDEEGGPVMPRPFLLEAFCQAGTWLIIASTAAAFQVLWNRDDLYKIGPFTEPVSSLVPHRD